MAKGLHFSAEAEKENRFLLRSGFQEIKIYKILSE